MADKKKQENKKVKKLSKKDLKKYKGGAVAVRLDPVETGAADQWRNEIIR